MNPTLLMQQHTKLWLAERVCELIADNAALRKQVERLEKALKSLGYVVGGKAGGGDEPCWL